MHECQFCKSKIPNNAKKCAHCGEWLPQPQPINDYSDNDPTKLIVYCPSCNTKNKKWDKNCIQCGWPLA